MICQRCLQRSATLVSRAAPSSSSSIIRNFGPAIRQPQKQIAAHLSRWYSSPSESKPAASGAEEPVFGTPLGDANAPAAEKPKLSSCPEGTILTGLNYFKNKTDPVALADEAYPEWLWRCLDVTKKADEGADEDAGDEFSKSKKQRKLALKRQRAAEARLLAEGNLDALAPKIPLQQQSINLPANEEGTSEGAIAAVEARETLRKAMRKERKAKIRETNYLKSM